jgi:hypothetical protein
MSMDSAIRTPRARLARRLAVAAAAAAMLTAAPAALGAGPAAARRATAAECTAWQTTSNRLNVRLTALGHAQLRGRRAYAASRLVGRLANELGGYTSLLAVGCLPLPPLPAEPAGSGSVLSTIPASLLRGFTFTPPQAPPAISQADAEAIAGHGIVRASQLANCSFSALPPGAPVPTLPAPLGSSGPPQPVTVFTFDRDCWIVSLPGPVPATGGPPPRPGQQPAPPRFSQYNLSLVDAQTGAFLMGVAG